MSSSHTNLVFQPTLKIAEDTFTAVGVNETGVGSRVYSTQFGPCIGIVGDLGKECVLAHISSYKSGDGSHKAFKNFVNAVTTKKKARNNYLYF